MGRRARRRRTSPTRATKPLPRLRPGERYWALSVPYKTPAPGAVWDRERGIHLYAGRDLPRELQPFSSKAYTLERLIENELNGDDRPGPSSVPPMTPRPVQIEAARAIARHCAAGGPQMLLADDTGVGKTLSAVLGAKAAARLRAAHRILVIADRPAAITIPSWARTIAAAGDGGYTWVVTTWDRLAKVKTRRWDVIVADEAQALRHPTTKRWASWEVLTGANRATNRPYQVLVTATPGHSPLELPYLAPAFAHAVGDDARRWGPKEFPRQLARHGFAIRNGKWADDAAARAADVARIQDWLTQGATPATIHRPAPWGPVPLSGLPVELDATQAAQYGREWAVFRKEMQLARRGSDAAKGRAALLRYRQKAGLIRVPQTAEWVAAQVEAGRQVAVSVQYVETAADPLVEALRDFGVDVATIFGQGRFDVEKERLRFQRGRAPVVVFTPTAAINLQAGEQLPGSRKASTTPRVGVFHQARWSGLQARQICGRTHRDHQVSPWSVMFAADTVEEAVSKVMVERFAAAADMVGGDTRMLADIAGLLHADWLPPDVLDAADAAA